jgi:hypothetical protein
MMTLGIWANFLVATGCVVLGFVLIRGRAKAAARIFPGSSQGPKHRAFASWNQAAGGVVLVAIGLLAFVFALLSVLTGHPFAN